MNRFRHRSLARLGTGFAVWAVGFAAVYALQGLGCAKGWEQMELGPTTVLRAVLAALVLATIGATAAMAFRFRRSRLAGGRNATSIFLRDIAAAAALAATAAAATTFMGVTALSMCN